jgi:hypothetical protein
MSSTSTLGVLLVPSTGTSTIRSLLLVVALVLVPVLVFQLALVLVLVPVGSYYTRVLLLVPVLILDADTRTSSILALDHDLWEAPQWK